MSVKPIKAFLENEGAARRVSVAMLIIAAFAFVCCLADAMFGAMEGTGAAITVRDVLNASSSEGEGQLEEVPEGFVQEVLDVSKADDVRVAANGSVVGFVEQGSAIDSFEGISHCLEEGGWHATESNRSDFGTFSKTSGNYRWLCVSCIQVGDAVSVVIQNVPSDDGKESS